MAKSKLGNYLLFILFFVVFVHPHTLSAQSETGRDSLLRQLKNMPEDTHRVKLLIQIAFQYHLNKPDTTYFLGQQAYNLAQQLRYKKGESSALNVMALAYNHLGDYAKAIKMYNQLKVEYAQLKDTDRLAITLNNLANVHTQQSDFGKALTIFQESYRLFKAMGTPRPAFEPLLLLNIGESFYELKQLDSAYTYFTKTLPLVKKYRPNLLGNILYDLGDVALARNNPAEARAYYEQSIAANIQDNSFTQIHEAYYRMAKLYKKSNQLDSTIHYAELALLYGKKSSYNKGILTVAQLLSSIHESKNGAEALRYYKIATEAKDSLFTQDKMKQLMALNFEEKQLAQQIEAANIAYKNQTRQYVFAGILGVFGLLALLLLRNNQQKNRANQKLTLQTEEVNIQRDKAEKTLSELQTTQTQLIQSEKLASLGELTAGIAHEIQNPLNFVNNFAELSMGIAEDLKEEFSKPEKDWGYIEELLNDLTENQQKINHHGKRASSIIKGMLGHSRMSTGKKELTDINALADEYLRLSYHGLRAKDKNFNALMDTNFDASIPKIDVISQDIGRVFLNLINNAFYAVSEKNKSLRNLPDSSNLETYKPTVSITTKYIDNTIEIRIADNGTGMPEHVKAKVFLPFFTTKPTGEGTGLGLSLAYDIVTKGHGGTMELESHEGKGTAFVIRLPTVL